MFGDVVEYSGHTNTFNVIKPNIPAKLYSNQTTIYGKQFKSSLLCEGALMETINIYNYQFLFYDIFGKMVFNFINQTTFPTMSDGITTYKKKISYALRNELEKLNSSDVNDGYNGWRTLSRSISHMGISHFLYDIYAESDTNDSFIAKPWFMIKEATNNSQNYNSPVHKNPNSLLNLHNLLNEGFEVLKTNKFEENDNTSYWQKIVSGYQTITNVLKNSHSNTTNFDVDLNEFTENGFEPEKTTNETSSASDTIFSWFKSNIEILSGKFLTYLTNSNNASSLL